MKFFWLAVTVLAEDCIAFYVVARPLARSNPLFNEEIASRRLAMTLPFENTGSAALVPRFTPIAP